MIRAIRFGVFALVCVLASGALAAVLLDINYDDTPHCVPCGWLETFSGCQMGTQAAAFFDDWNFPHELTCDDIDKLTPFDRPLPSRKHQSLR